MKFSIRGFVLILSFFILSGCQPDTGSSSKVRIRIPTKDEFRKANQVGKLSAIDYNLLCFAVNVRGGSIPLKKTTCDITKGIISGAVAPGGALVVEVPFAYSVAFEILGLLRVSATDPCPKVTDGAWNFPLERIYSLGETSDVRIEKAETNLEIGVTMPDFANNIAQQFNFPNICKTDYGNKTNARFASGAAVQAGTIFRAYARATDKEDSKVLQGTTYRIQQWKTGVGP